MRIKLSTSNGAIDLQLDSTRQNDVIASTSNGSITSASVALERDRACVH